MNFVSRLGMTLAAYAVAFIIAGALCYLMATSIPMELFPIHVLFFVIFGGIAVTVCKEATKAIWHSAL